jgi:phosphoglucosamine mutase
MRKYVGTDGIRGNVGTTAIRPDFLLSLGHAVGRVLKLSNPKPAFLIGRDTRVSGYMIQAALESGFLAAGVDVHIAGSIPTPAVAYLTQALRLDLGVVISASHNPYHDNGIKFFSDIGEKLGDSWENQVEAMMEQPPSWQESHGLGKTCFLTDAGGRYVEFCKNTFEGNLKGMKIVIDGAHGAAYTVAPKVFHELGAQVITIGCSPNGFNINDQVGATSPKALVAAVQEQGADYGIALDGDADRILLVDSSGRQYDGDQVLYILAVHRKRSGFFTPGVVGTVMTNMGIEAALNRADIQLVRAKVGDKNILHELSKRPGWVLGGESSGHILTLDKHSTGDGIIAALQVLQAVNGTTLAEMLAGAPMFPQIIKNVRLEPGEAWDTLGFQAALVNANDQLEGKGRTLVRASGTEPVVRVMAECADSVMAQEIVDYLVRHLGS